MMSKSSRLVANTAGIVVHVSYHGPSKSLYSIIAKLNQIRIGNSGGIEEV